MSGGGGGGGGGGGSPPSPCETLRFDAQITSPQATVVAKLTAGDVLDIALGNLKGQTVVQVLKGGAVAGGLTGPDAARLRACLDEGHNYVAAVLSINAGQVRVRIAHI